MASGTVAAHDAARTRVAEPVLVAHDRQEEVRNCLEEDEIAWRWATDRGEQAAVGPRRTVSLASSEDWAVSASGRASLPSVDLGASRSGVAVPMVRPMLGEVVEGQLARPAVQLESGAELELEREQGTD